MVKLSLVYYNISTATRSVCFSLISEFDSISGLIFQNLYIYRIGVAALLLVCCRFYLTQEMNAFYTHAKRVLTWH